MCNIFRFILSYCFFNVTYFRFIKIQIAMILKQFNLHMFQIERVWICDIHKARGRARLPQKTEQQSGHIR